jgi:hypothetical protein
VTYAEWAQDSLEAADFGQEVVYPVENTPHPNYDNPRPGVPATLSFSTKFSI